MIRRLVCRRHGVKCRFDEVTDTREFDLPVSGPPTMCALLLADRPRAGELHIPNEAGGQTSYSCEIVEEEG